MDRLEDIKGSDGSPGEIAGWVASIDGCTLLSKGKEVPGGQEGGIEGRSAGISITGVLADCEVHNRFSCLRRCVTASAKREIMSSVKGAVEEADKWSATGSLKTTEPVLGSLEVTALGALVGQTACALRRGLLDCTFITAALWGRFRCSLADTRGIVNLGEIEKRQKSDTKKGGKITQTVDGKINVNIKQGSEPCQTKYVDAISGKSLQNNWGDHGGPNHTSYENMKDTTAFIKQCTIKTANKQTDMECSTN